MNDINHVGKKSKKNKKKAKNHVIISEEMKSLVAKEAEAEDLAESVDSGCIPDSSSDIVADVTDTVQVSDMLLIYLLVYAQFGKE